MTERQLRLLHDSRLTDAARILGLYLSTLPEGPHEMKHDDLAVLLHGTPNADTVGRHLRQLVVHGYAARVSSGGKGSPRYEWVISAREKTRAEPSARENSRAEPPVVVDGDDAIPPIIPLRTVSAEADAAIERYGDRLAGCRGAIRDYLREVVPTERQRAWVDDVAAKLNGLGFNWLGVPDQERAGLAAAAVNELRAQGEGKMRYPAGDPRNLRTKLGILVQDRVNGPSRATGTDGKRIRAGPRSDSPPDAQDYTLKPFRGLNG